MSLERTHIDFTVVAAAVTVVESSLEPTSEEVVILRDGPITS